MLAPKDYDANATVLLIKPKDSLPGSCLTDGNAKLVAQRPQVF
jgi:hypothetical protein